VTSENGQNLNLNDNHKPVVVERSQQASLNHFHETDVESFLDPTDGLRRTKIGRK